MFCDFFFDFLPLKNYVKVVPSKEIRRKFFFKKLPVFCWHLEGQCWKQKDPDPLVRGMDPQIWIHTKFHGSATLLPTISDGHCKTKKIKEKDSPRTQTTFCVISSTISTSPFLSASLSKRKLSKRKLIFNSANSRKISNTDTQMIYRSIRKSRWS